MEQFDGSGGFLAHLIASLEERVEKTAYADFSWNLGKICAELVLAVIVQTVPESIGLSSVS